MKKVLITILYPIGWYMICFAASCLGAYFLTGGEVTAEQYLIATIWGLGATIGAFVGCISRKKTINKKYL